jgi:hypothetical protein
MKRARVDISHYSSVWEKKQNGGVLVDGVEIDFFGSLAVNLVAFDVF